MHVRDCPYNPDTDISPLTTVVTESFTVKEILACSSQHLKGSKSLELLGHVVGSLSVGGVLDVRSGTKAGKPQTWTWVSQGTNSNEDIIDRFAGMKPRRMALTNALTATDAVWTAIMSVSVDIELFHVLCRTLLLKLF